MRIVSIKDKRIKAPVEMPGRSSVKGPDPIEVRKIGPMGGATLSMATACCTLAPLDEQHTEDVAVARTRNSAGQKMPPHLAMERH